VTAPRGHPSAAPHPAPLTAPHPAPVSGRPPRQPTVAGRPAIAQPLIASVLRGKGGRARVAVFGDESAQALWKWLTKRGREPGPLFTSCRGERPTPRSWPPLAKA